MRGTQPAIAYPMTTTTAKLDTFTLAYIECALWSSMDDDCSPLDDNFGREDIHEIALAEMASDCADFQSAQAELLESISAEQAGHDFWLTRNHHGAGFWDRGLGELGKKLTQAAYVYGSQDLYVGENGQLYIA